MVLYATHKDITVSLDISMPYNTTLMNNKLEAASRSIEGLCHRRFYPEIKTVKFDWPNYQYANTGQLWLDSNEVISVSSLVSGGTTIPSTEYFLRRTDDRDEPPYNIIELNHGTASVFSAGSTSQRSISVTGLFGFSDTSTAVPAATVTAGINAAVTTLTVSPSGGIFDIAPGALILIGTERLNVLASNMSTTSQNLLNTITASKSDNSLTVTDGTKYAKGETILINSERMYITDIAGNVLTVYRAHDGSVLAAHTLGAGSPIYALRELTVERGVLGSTAAVHSTSDPVYVHKFPGMINELAIAETITALEQASSGYARVVGAGNNAREATGKGLEDLREQVMRMYGRRNRVAAI